MEFFVFVCAALMVLGGAIGVVLRPNPVHAALSMVLTLFGVAVLFVAQEAHFLAAVQVIVHVSRTAAGRRLSDIAVLHRDDAGYCHAVPAWQIGRGRRAGAELLSALIDGRRGR